jgi:hypothetical protein
VTASPPGLAFFAASQGVHGILRSGVSVLFDARGARAVPEPVELVADGEAYRARLPGRLDLLFAPVSEPADMGGSTIRVCRVTGAADGRQLDCMGTASEVQEPPRWAELDVTRTVSALWDPQTALLLDARRPRSALGHGQELVRAWLYAEGRLWPVEEARLSTIYDAHGRQRTAGLELWLEHEDLPRRSSGAAVAGTSLQLERLRVDAAVFAWSMDGREGFGAYELTVRDEPAAA